MTKTLFITLCSLIAGSAVLVAAGRIAGIRLNQTPSMPIGLYRQNSTGQAVEFCLDEPFAGMARERGYRMKASLWAACPDGWSALMKPISAREKDVVDVSEQGVRVNGRLLAKSKPLEKDSNGRPMPTLRGTYVVQPGQIWVISSYSSDSFDSRYFGRVKVSSVRASLSPLLVWNSGSTVWHNVLRSGW